MLPADVISLVVAPPPPAARAPRISKFFPDRLARHTQD